MLVHYTIEPKDAFDWIDAATTFGSVILGAVLAYAATRVSERRKERSERIARATLLVLKVRTVVDGVFKLDRQLQQGIARAQAAGVSGPPWTMFEEISAIGDYEEVITIEDMAVLAERGLFDTIQTITELRDGHNGVIKALEQLFRIKNDLATALPPNQVQNNVAVFMGTLSPQAQMMISALDMLSADILRSINDQKQRARELAPKLHKELTAALRLKNFPSIVLP